MRSMSSVDRSPRPELSIIIPTWNGAPILKRCIDAAVRAAGVIPHELLVWDNHSSDDTPRLLERLSQSFPQLRWVRHPVNVYFAKAVNEMALQARGRHLLVLNNDAFLAPDSIERMLKGIKGRVDVGAVAPQLVHPNGHVQPSCNRFPRLFPPSIRGLSRRLSSSDHHTRRYVEQPMMAVLLVKAKCWWDVGPLDERFPLYFNDVDWCKRAVERGWKIMFMPEARAVHLRGWSGRRLGYRQGWLWTVGMYRYFVKHELQPGSPIKIPILYATCGSAFLLWCIRHLRDSLFS